MSYIWDSKTEKEGSLGLSAISKNTPQYKTSKRIYDCLVKVGALTELTKEEKNAHKKISYVKPAVPHYGLDWPKAGTGGKVRPGSRYGKMTDIQKSKFLEILKNGLHEALALEQVGISNGKLLNEAFRDDPVFKADYEQALRHGEGLLEQIIEMDAKGQPIENASVSSALALRRLQEDTKSRREAARMGRRKIELEKIKTEALIHASDKIARSTNASIHLTNLSVDEITRYTYLYNNMMDLSDEDLKEFRSLHSRALEKKKDPQSSANLALNGLAKVAEQFNREDEEDQ